MRAATALLSLALLAATASPAQPAPQPGQEPPHSAGLPASGPNQPPPPPPGAAPSDAKTPAAAPVQPPPPASAPPPLAAGLARLAGKVTIAGLAPRLAALPVTRDMRVCGTSKADEALETGPGGGIRYAVLWLKDGPKPKKGDKPPHVKLDQVACSFVPHVLVTTAGAQLDIVNSDGVLHNVHGREGEKTVFNYAMPIKGYDIPRKLTNEGFVKLGCDVHPWMHASLAVLPTTAFAVTDAYGSYVIDVPPGKYALKLWHERLGEREETVELAAGQTLQHDLSLTPK